ncbi:MAG: protein translocase subunit SecF [Candidatus Falkowbacteria bacterium]
MYQIIQKRNISLFLSGVLVAASMIALLIWGFNYGIDFTGGSLLEVRFKDGRPAVNDVRQAIEGLEPGNLILQPIGESSLILRFQDTSEGKHQAVLEKLRELTDNGKETDPEKAGEEGVDVTIGEDGAVLTTPAESALKAFEELRYDAIGPAIGRELKNRSITAIIIVLIMIVLYIAWAFRQVSKPVASWKYGLAATIALFHDVIITMGVFAVLGRFYGVEINTPFVAALLTVLGYSINDTIVVFDRIRENLPKSEEDFENTVNVSVNQTITRSISTSLTTLLALSSILIFGGASIRDFVLALCIGVFIGTYSSIFVASPILVIWEKMTSRNS